MGDAGRGLETLVSVPMFSVSEWTEPPDNPVVGDLSASIPREAKHLLESVSL